MKPELYLHYKQATHFLRWEVKHFQRYFTLVDQPHDSALLMAFGPDVLEEAATLPAARRFITTFPGFGSNPVYNHDLRQKTLPILRKQYQRVFINPGPLELAYKTLPNVTIYPFSIDDSLITFKNYRTRLDSLLHVSADYPQKDWPRSQTIMQNTGLRYEVFPPRDNAYIDPSIKWKLQANTWLKKFHLPSLTVPPAGYVPHKTVVKKYQQYDGFVHVARDIRDPIFLDGKYTASLMEAGMTGAILFWHDTFKLGNNLETVFALPIDEDKAAQKILDIRQSIDIKKHSQKTREEMLDVFNAAKSVAIRAEAMLA